MRLLWTFCLMTLGSLIVAEQGQKQDEWTPSEIEKVKDLLRDFFNEDQTRCPPALRLPFHDCVGVTGRNCDGCINLGNPDNAGLELIFFEMNLQYDTIFPLEGKTMSRADFYVLGGIVAVEITTDINNNYCEPTPDCYMPQVDFNFVTGRVDCPTSPEAPSDLNVGFPGAFFNNSQVIDYWNAKFGMTAQETVALLGAHTLGGLHREASGYDGDWKVGQIEPFMFNNGYYKLMLNFDQQLKWNHYDAAAQSRAPEDERFMWEGVDDAMEKKAHMINADMSLILQLQVKDVGGESLCNYDTNRCEDAPTKPLAQLYAEDGALWANDFAKVFNILTDPAPYP